GCERVGVGRYYSAPSPPATSTQDGVGIAAPANRRGGHGSISSTPIPDQAASSAASPIPGRASAPAAATVRARRRTRGREDANDRRLEALISEVPSAYDTVPFG